MIKPSVYILVDINQGRTFGIFPTFEMAWQARQSLNEVVLEHGALSNEMCLTLYHDYVRSRLTVEEWTKKNLLHDIYAVEILARGMELDHSNGM